MKNPPSVDNPKFFIIKKQTHVKNSLIIFAKRPVPGNVKTRLVPFLSEEKAAGLYEAMLLDVVERTSQLDAERVLFYASSEGAGEYFSEVGRGCYLKEQACGDLGERMEQAFAEVFLPGFEAAVIIGTDSPDVPMSYLEEAFRVLEEGSADAVIGPCEDGGYYLLGMRKVLPVLFRDIHWSTAHVVADTVKQAQTAGIKVALLPTWYDVDEPDDLRRPSLTAENSPARRTREFLLDMNSGE